MSYESGVDSDATAEMSVDGDNDSKDTRRMSTTTLDAPSDEDDDDDDSDSDDDNNKKPPALPPDKKQARIASLKARIDKLETDLTTATTNAATAYYTDQLKKAHDELDNLEGRRIVSAVSNASDDDDTTAKPPPAGIDLGEHTKTATKVTDFDQTHIDGLVEEINKTELPTPVELPVILNEAASYLPVTVHTDDVPHLIRRDADGKPVALIDNVLDIFGQPDDAYRVIGVTLGAINEKLKETIGSTAIQALDRHFQGEMLIEQADSIHEQYLVNDTFIADPQYTDEQRVYFIRQGIQLAVLERAYRLAGFYQQLAALPNDSLSPEALEFVDFFNQLITDNVYKGLNVNFQNNAPPASRIQKKTTMAGPSKRRANKTAASKAAAAATVAAARASVTTTATLDDPYMTRASTATVAVPDNRPSMTTTATTTDPNISAPVAAQKGKATVSAVPQGRPQKPQIIAQSAGGELFKAFQAAKPTTPEEIEAFKRKAEEEGDNDALRAINHALQAAKRQRWQDGLPFQLTGWVRQHAPGEEPDKKRFKWFGAFQKGAVDPSKLKTLEEVAWHIDKLRDNENFGTSYMRINVRFKPAEARFEELLRGEVADAKLQNDDKKLLALYRDAENYIPTAQITADLRREVSAHRPTYTLIEDDKNVVRKIRGIKNLQDYLETLQEDDKTSKAAMAKYEKEFKIEFEKALLANDDDRVDELYRNAVKVIPSSDVLKKAYEQAYDTNLTMDDLPEEEQKEAAMIWEEIAKGKTKISDIYSDTTDKKKGLLMTKKLYTIYGKEPEEWSPMDIEALKNVADDGVDWVKSKLNTVPNVNMANNNQLTNPDQHIVDNSIVNKVPDDKKLKYKDLTSRYTIAQPYEFYKEVFDKAPPDGVGIDDDYLEYLVTRLNLPYVDPDNLTDVKNAEVTIKKELEKYTNKKVVDKDNLPNTIPKKFVHDAIKMSNAFFALKRKTVQYSMTVAANTPPSAEPHTPPAYKPGDDQYKLRGDPEGYERVPVKGDGNCLYRSVAQIMGGNEEDYARYKDEILAHMWDNQHLYNYLINPVQDKMTYEEYLQKAAVKDAWASELEVAAVSNLYGVTVAIHKYRTNPQTGEDEYIENESFDWPPHGKKPEDGRIIHIYNINDVHFDPLKRKSATTTSLFHNIPK